MKKTLLVMVNEIRTTLRRKTFMIIGFGIPLLLAIIALVMIVINRDSSSDSAITELADDAAETESLSEGYVDTGDLIKEMPDNIPAGWLVEYPDETAAQEALEAGEIKAFYIVAPEYVETGDIIYVTQSFNMLGGDVNTSGMEWILLFNVFEGDEQLAAAVWNPLELEVTDLEAADETATEDSWVVELLPNMMALVLYMVILISAGVLVQAVTDEKKNRVLEVLLSSVSTNQMITGKIMGVAILGLLILVAWGGLMWGVVKFGGSSLSIPAGFEIPRHLLYWAGLYALLGYLMYGSLMAGLGALAPDVKDTRSASLVILSPFIITYMFLIIIIESPNGVIAIALSLFPLTSPVAMITRMTVTEIPLWQSALAAVLQLVGAYVIVRTVARLFRAQALLSGQPFGIKQYFGALIGRT